MKNSTTPILDSIDATDAQIRLISGILREALDICERLRTAAQCAENAKTELAAARRAVARG
jgi:hypothetical protein